MFEVVIYILRFFLNIILNIVFSFCLRTINIFSMKTIYSIFLFLISFTVSSQITEFDREEAKTAIENQIESLGLNDYQKTKFKEINQKYQQKLFDLKNSDKQRFTKFKILQKLQNEKDDEIKMLLNKEQFKVYKNYQKQRRNRIRTNIVFD